MGLSASSKSTEESTRPDIYSGLNAKQKECIRKTWKLMTRDKERHGIKIIVRFFRKYPPYRRYFLDSDNVKMSELVQDPGVQRHCRAYMNEIDYLIYVISNKPQNLDNALENLAKIHKDMKIGNRDCNRLNRILVNYMKKEFPMQFSQLEEETWRLFLGRVKEIFLQKMAELRIEDMAADEREKQALFSTSSLDSNESSNVHVRNVQDAEKNYWEERRTYWKYKHSYWRGNKKDQLHIHDDEDEELYIISKKKLPTRFFCFSKFLRKPEEKENTNDLADDESGNSSDGSR